MRLDYLREPVADDEPAGPDLDEAADTGYFNYVLAADSRMPERYFTVDQVSGGYVQFDSSSIDLDAEISAIDGLLHRTRDIRLLGFDARFNVLSGNITGFCEAIEGMAMIVAGFWPSFHPRPIDGDYIQRQNVVDGLDDQPRVVQPLQYANIAGGTRSRAVTYRNFLVATDKVPAREDEERVPIEEIARTISGLNQKGDPVEELRTRVAEIHAAALAALAAIDLMTKTFAANVEAEYVPSLRALPETLKGIVDLITTYRRDLLPDGGETEATADEAEDEERADGAPRLPAGAVKTHGEARRALGAVERYLLFNEPSSPALVLVHQSRMLIGRPLVEALAALMPDAAERAALRFDAGFRFDIDLTRMRAVTEDALAQYETELAAASAEAGDDTGGTEPEPESDDSGWGSSWSTDEGTEANADEDAAGEPDSSAPDDADPEAAAAADGEPAAAEAMADATAAPEPDSEPAPSSPAAAIGFFATTRNQAADLISSTESFFRTVEPSSPLPILLAKARGYLNRDFASILSELMPREPDE